jgi:hypothetical protein
VRALLAPDDEKLSSWPNTENLNAPAQSRSSPARRGRGSTGLDGSGDIAMAARQKPEHLYAIKKRVGPWGTVYRVSLTRAGETAAKLFRDHDHGGSRAALKAAKAWRDAQFAVLTPKTRAEFGRMISVKNTSGCPGVYRRKTVKDGRDYWFWQAQSPPGAGQMRSRSFSVN